MSTIEDVIVARIKRDQQFAADRTTCQRKGVGCSLMDQKERFFGAPFINGAIGLEHSICAGKDAVHRCGCMHAEQRAIIWLMRQEGPSASLLCNYAPCWSCAYLIVGSQRIHNVFYMHDQAPDNRGVEILERSYVTHWKLKR